MKNGYRPNRSQSLFIIRELERRFGSKDWWRDRFIVHHVLEDTPTRLYVQIEHHHILFDGDRYITFKRVEL